MGTAYIYNLEVIDGIHTDADLNGYHGKVEERLVSMDSLTACAALSLCRITSVMEIKTYCDA